MDSRERTFLSLGFQEPDRVPIDLWMSSGFAEKIPRMLGVTVERFLDDNDVDLRYIPGPEYIGPPSQSTAGVELDLWGVPRRKVRIPTAEGAETYSEVTEPPLAGARSVDEIEDYSLWPSPDWFDYRGIRAQCERVRGKGRVAVFMGDRLNRIAQLKPALYLRGVEQILLDMCLQADLADAVLGRIRSFYRRYLERILEAANGTLDILLTGDDFGAQHGPLVSPAMWERFLGDGFALYAGIARSAGVRIMHHTCGSVRPIVPLMIERGLEILQSLQPEAADMDPHGLKAEFGGRLAFHGGISIQRTMPFGAPAEIEAEVRSRVEALAGGGGYILCTSHNVQADTPLRNLSALLAAYRRFGTYR